MTISMPLTHAAAIAADGLQMHPDPADRFIVATSVHLQAAIVTKDKMLRKLDLVRTIW